jgi:hypothetical protein
MNQLTHYFQLLAPSNEDRLKPIPKKILNAVTEGRAVSPINHGWNGFDDFSAYLDETIFQLQGFNGDKPRPFYHQCRFLVVSENIKRFLIDNVKEDIEVFEVNVFSTAGMPIKARYYAVQVVNFLDCVDLNQSIYRGSTFATAMASARQYEAQTGNAISNFDPNHPTFPSCAGADTVILKYQSIAVGTSLFVPEHFTDIFIEGQFSASLDAKITEEGGPGDNFWALGLRNPNKEIWDLMRDRR